MTNDEFRDFVARSEATMQARIAAHEAVRAHNAYLTEVAMQNRAPDGILPSDLEVRGARRQVFDSAERPGGGGWVVPLLLVAAGVVAVIVWGLL